MSAVEDSAKASSSSAWHTIILSGGTGAAPCAVASCGAAPGRGSSDGVRTDSGVTGMRGIESPMFAEGTSRTTSDDSFPCRPYTCKSQGTAAEVEAEVMGDGDTTFLAASAAGGMSGIEGLADDVRGRGRRWQLCTLTITFFGGVRGHRNGGGGGV